MVIVFYILIISIFMYYGHLTGAEVFSLESFVTPLIPSAPNHTLPEVAYWTPTLASLEGSSLKYLIHIR